MNIIRQTDGISLGHYFNVAKLRDKHPLTPNIEIYATN